MARSSEGPDPRLLRRLADWATDGYPVTTAYLNVDGRRYPRRGDFLLRLDDLLRKAENGEVSRDRRRSVESDAERMRGFVREFDRRGSRGLAMFSCSAADLWESAAIAVPVRDRVVVGARPHLLPLEALLETNGRVCTVLVDREKARVFTTSGWEIREISHVLDDVPGRHDQGGWAQARMQRHIRDHVQRHLKHVAEVLLREHKRRGFDHLMLSGPEEVVADLERELHDYLRRRVVARATLPMVASAAEVLERAAALGSELQARREREAVGRLVSEVASATGRAVAGLDETLGALEAGRVDTLIVTFALEASGVRCPSCGHLGVGGGPCPLCGADVEEAPDLVEEAVESALRQRCRVESVEDDPQVAALGGIGALLRF